MDRVMQEISVLLNSRPQSPATDPKALLYAFGIAVEGIAPEAVIKTCRRYIRGEIENDDRRFAPSSAEFAHQCKDQAAADIYAAREKAERLPEPEFSEEHRAMMRRRFAELRASLDGNFTQAGE